MSNRYVTDTMALILYLEKRKLPKIVSQIFSEVESNISELIIPAMVLAEIGYLSEKGRIDTDLKAIKALQSRFSNIVVAPMDMHIITIAFEIKNIPELHDRLITATALVSKAGLITNDPVITDSHIVSIIW